MTISDDEFERLIADALDSLPEERVRGLQNVAITYEDEPTEEQRKKLHLRGSQTLYGLYEGTPLTKRASVSSLLSGVAMTMPDKITIFKLPIANNAESMDDVREQVRHTVWHEIAHYYGLDHDQISRLE